MKTITEKPLVSIVCMTFRHEKYIRKAVESFREQRLNAVEFIIVDDCSPDKTYSIALDAAGCDCRFRIFRNDKNIGAIENSRYSLSLARGEFIGFCEGDDFLIGGDRLERQLALLSNSEISMVFTASENVNDGGGRLSVNGYGSEIKYFSFGQAVRIGGNLCATSSTLYRRSIIEALPPEFFRFPVGDYPLQIIAASLGTIAYLPIMGSAYRIFSQASWSKDMSCPGKYLANHFATIKMLDFLYLFCGERAWASFEFSKAKYFYFLSLNSNLSFSDRLIILSRSGQLGSFFLITLFVSPIMRRLNSIRRWLVSARMSRGFF